MPFILFFNSYPHIHFFKYILAKGREGEEKGGRKGEKREGRVNGERQIVAKALDGQRYPLPLCEYMLMCDGERGSGPKGANDLCTVISFPH